MPEKIEVTPFIRWDIKKVLTNSTKFFHAQFNGTLIEAVPAKAFDEVVESIMLKVTDFVNENYTPKP